MIIEVLDSDLIQNAIIPNINDISNNSNDAHNLAIPNSNLQVIRCAIHASTGNNKWDFHKIPMP